MLPKKITGPEAKPGAHHVLILHEVQDYPAWKLIFDAATELRKSAGEIAFQVLCHDDNPNRVVHFSAWSSHIQAKRFFESPELEQIRQKAGVKSPTFIYLHELDAGVL